MPGVLPDVMSSSGDTIWMRGVNFDADLEIRNTFAPHLFCSAGFLDDTWWELTYWIYGEHMFGGRSGVAHAARTYPTARIMVCDEDKVYGYQDGYESVKEPLLMAWNKDAKVVTEEERQQGEEDLHPRDQQLAGEGAGVRRRPCALGRYALHGRFTKDRSEQGRRVARKAES